jgi:hypothetical protein
MVVVNRGGFFSSFMQMYLTWVHSTWTLALGCPPLIILLYVLQHKSFTARRKLHLTLCFLLKIHVMRDREKSSGQTNMFNIWTLEAKKWTEPRSTPGQAEPIALYFFKNSTTGHWRYYLTQELAVEGVLHAWNGGDYILERLLTDGAASKTVTADIQVVRIVRS